MRCSSSANCASASSNLRAKYASASSGVASGNWPHSCSASRTVTYTVPFSSARPNFLARATDSAGARAGCEESPLFEPASDAVESGDVAVGSGAWTAVHHAFTSPKPEFMDTFDTDPGSALAYAYELG